MVFIYEFGDDERFEYDTSDSDTSVAEVLSEILMRRHSTPSIYPTEKAVCEAFEDFIKNNDDIEEILMKDYEDELKTAYEHDAKELWQECKSAEEGQAGIEADYWRGRGVRIGSL